MVFDVPPIKSVALGDQLAHHLRIQVVSGRLAPGTRLVEETLAQEFGVSRGPVRDALKVLEREGLIESRRRGAFVVGLAESDIDELYSLRETLESLAVRLIVNGSGQADWSTLERAVAVMHSAAELGDPRSFAEADLDFHAEFYRRAGHRRLLTVWEHYRPTFSVMLNVTNAQDEDLRPSAEAHAELLQVICSGDVERSLLCLSEHLLGARNRLRSALTTAFLTTDHSTEQQ